SYAPGRGERAGRVSWGMGDPALRDVPHLGRKPFHPLIEKPFGNKRIAHISWGDGSFLSWHHGCSPPGGRASRLCTDPPVMLAPIIRGRFECRGAASGEGDTE